MKGWESSVLEVGNLALKGRGRGRGRKRSCAVGLKGLLDGFAVAALVFLVKFVSGLHDACEVLLVNAGVHGSEVVLDVHLVASPDNVVEDIVVRAVRDGLGVNGLAALVVVDQLEARRTHLVWHVLDLFDAPGVLENVVFRTEQPRGGGYGLQTPLRVLHESARASNDWLTLGVGSASSQAGVRCCHKFIVSRTRFLLWNDFSSNAEWDLSVHDRD